MLKWNHIVYVLYLLLSLNTMLIEFHVNSNLNSSSNFFTFLAIQYYNVCTYHDLFIQSVLEEHLPHSQLELSYRSCSENFCRSVRVNVSQNSSNVRFKSGILGSQGMHIFKFAGSCQTIFQIDTAADENSSCPTSSTSDMVNYFF